VGRNGLVLTYGPSQGGAGVSDLKEVHVYTTPPQDQGPLRGDRVKLPPPARRVEKERSARLREIGTLARQRDEAAATALAQILALDPDPTVRAKAAAALGKVGEAESAMALSMALMDQDPSVRIQVARASGRVEGDQVTPTLGGVLMGDPDSRVRREAARVLGAVRT